MLKGFEVNLTLEKKSTRNRYVIDFASVVAGRATMLVTVRFIPLPAWEKAGRVKFA